MRVSCRVCHASDRRALEYVIRWQVVFASKAEVVTQQSAAVRRLAALMQRDDDAKPHTVLPGTEGLAAVDRVGLRTGDRAAGGDRRGPRTVDRQGC